MDINELYLAYHRLVSVPIWNERKKLNFRWTQNQSTGHKLQNFIQILEKFLSHGINKKFVWKLGFLFCATKGLKRKAADIQINSEVHIWSLATIFLGFSINIFLSKPHVLEEMLQFIRNINNWITSLSSENVLPSICLWFNYF